MKGKKYKNSISKIDRNKAYNVEEAIKLVKETSTSKFDETVEIAIRLNVDVKKAEQQLRGAIVLPHGTGKSKKVLVVAKGDKAKDAQKAGADYVGEQDILHKIESENWMDFDVIISTPDMMPALGKLGKILGPKGLMPNPKVGTVTLDVVKAVEDIKKGKVEYKTDSFGNVHAILGKSSFDENKLIENLKTFVEVIMKSKPSIVKGDYVKNISISATMGPGIKLDLNSFDK